MKSFTDLLMRLPALRTDPSTPTNYTQIFTKPFDAREWVACSYCGRRRGSRYTCDGCGAPSVLVKHETIQGYLPLSLEWWRQRIADTPKPSPVHMEFGPLRCQFWNDPAWPDG